MSTEVDPLWRFNISKKIAQLTKVVFRLHTDSIDHRDSLLELKEKYEDEISYILEKSQTHLRSAEEEAEQLHPAIDDVVNREFETKFNQTKAHFDTACILIMSQTLDLIKNATQQLEGLKERLETLKKKSNDDILEFKEAAEEIGKLQEATTTQMENHRKKSLTGFIDEANAKYGATLQITQKKEKEIKEKYDNELVELKKTLESSKISAEDTLNGKITEINEKIEKIEEEKAQLLNLMKEFSQKSSVHQTELLSVLKKAENMRDKIVEVQQKDLNNFQGQLNKIRDDHLAEVKKIRDKINLEEKEHYLIMKKKKDELEQQKVMLQKQMEEYEEIAKKMANEAEVKNQKLIQEQNFALEKFEQEKIEYINKEHAKSHEINKVLLEMQKKHSKEVNSVRNNIEKELENYLKKIEDMKISHKNAISKLKEENEIEVQKLQIQLSENYKDSSNEFKNLLIQSSKLKNSIELSKYEYGKNYSDLDKLKERQMNHIQKVHEEQMSCLDHEFDLEIKEIDDSINESIEKAKRQHVINFKYADEKEKLDLKYSLEKTRNEIDLKKQLSLEVIKDKCESELSALSQQIEAKTIEKKETDAKYQQDIIEYASKLADLQKEVKTSESNWIDEKQKLINDWSNKFDMLKKQFSDEEKQNEDTRKMNDQKCQEMIEKLKTELSVEEERKIKELAKVNELIEQETKRGQKEINWLKDEIKRMSSNREGSVHDLEKSLKMLEVERAAILKKENEKKHQEIKIENAKIKERRKKCQDEIGELKTTLIETVHKNEQKLLEMKNKLEKAQIDSEFEIEEFKRKKQLELSMKEVHNQHELDLLAVELSRLQSEAERRRNEGNQRTDSLKQLEKERCDEMAKEVIVVRQRTEIDNEKQIAEKEKIITELQKRIRESSESLKNSEPRIEDLENISRLEELLSERQDAMERMEEEYRKYESIFVEHEAHFITLRSAKQTARSQSPPMIMAPTTQKRLTKKDGVSTSVLSSQKRVPPLVDPSINRKNKTPV